MSDEPQTLADLGLSERSGDIVAFPQGATLMREGDGGDALFVLVEGRVEITKVDQHLAFIDPINVIGEMALIDGGARSATVLSVDECRALKLDKAAFMDLAAKDTRLFLFVLKSLSLRLRKSSETAAAALSLVAQTPDAPPDLVARLKTVISVADADRAKAQAAKTAASKTPPNGGEAGEVRWDD